MLVAAPVIDASGTVIDHVLDAVTYSKTSITANKWNLIGNGKKLAVTVSPGLYRLRGRRHAQQLPGAQPGIGLLADIQAQKPDPSIPTNPPVKLMDTATLQMPGGFSIAFGYCNRPSMCISSTPGTTSLIPHRGHRRRGHPARGRGLGGQRRHGAWRVLQGQLHHRRRRRGCGRSTCGPTCCPTRRGRVSRHWTAA